MFIWLLGFSVSLFHHQPIHTDFHAPLRVMTKPSYGSALFNLDGPMETFLNEQVALEAGGQRLTLQGFHNIIFGKRGLGFKYQPITRKPIQSFKSGSGNCISLTLLVAAFANKLDFEINFRQVITRERARGVTGSHKWWLADHIQVQVSHRGRTRTFDPLPRKVGPHVRFKRLEKEQVVALYYGNLAVATHRKGQPEQALLQLKLALQLDYGSPILWNNLGAVLRSLKRYPEAQRSFQRAISLSKSFKAPVENLALLYFLTHRIEDAKATYGQISRRQNPYSMILQGLKAASNNDHGKENDWFEKAVGLLPQSREILEAVIHHSRSGKSLRATPEITSGDQ